MLLQFAISLPCRRTDGHDRHGFACSVLPCTCRVADVDSVVSGQVRNELRQALEKRLPDKDWSFVTSQIGMFTMTPLTPEQVGPTDPPGLAYSDQEGAVLTSPHALIGGFAVQDEG